MKRIIQVIAVALLAFVLLALLLYKLVFSNSDSKTTIQTPQQDPFAQVSDIAGEIQTDSPSATAQSCFKWYIYAVGYGADGLQAQARQEASSCFTQEFISEWDDTIASADGDPVLLTQYVGSTWSTISVSAVDQSIDSSDQLVTMGTGNDQHKVIAHVVRDRTTNTWKIASVKNP